MSLKISNAHTSNVSVLTERFVMDAEALPNPARAILVEDTWSLIGWADRYVCIAPVLPVRRFTVDEQRILQSALRRSVKMVHKAKRA